MCVSAPQTVFKKTSMCLMSDQIVLLWIDTATEFSSLIQSILQTSLSEKSIKKLNSVQTVIDEMIKQAEKHPRKTFTHDNLQCLIECWDNFKMCTKGSQYWHKEFPEWSFMITQFHILTLDELIHHPVHRDSRNEYRKLGQSLEILLSKLE